MSIEEGLITKLLDNAPVRSLVSSRIYAQLIDERATFPAIGIELEDDEPEMAMAGASGLTKALLTINCWASTPAAAKNLREKVRLALNGYRGRMGSNYCRACFLQDGGDVTYQAAGNNEQRKYGVQLEATLWYTEQIPSHV